MKYRLTNENFVDNYGENILRARGIEDVKSFLNPTINNKQCAYQLEEIIEGSNIVKSVLELENPRILMIVDCDVDGFTSSAIMYQYLKKIKEEVLIDYFIHEGKQHGLEDMIDAILENENRYNLLIIPDASSNDFEYIEQLKQINLPVLILDHHIVDAPISDNCILINNQVSPFYKNKNLSGAGIVYQFCTVLDNIFGVDYARDFIDLAALGICADMMDGREIENQYFWKEGFSKINNYFFLTLARKQGYSITGKTSPSDSEIIEKLNPMTVAFYIVPLINAMIRVGTMAEKQRLFLGFIDGRKMVPCNKRGAKGTMEEVAVESVRECVNAKTHQDKDKKEISERLEIKIHKNDLLENKVLFIRLDDDDDFPSELNGLCCMQLSAKYNKPTIVARLNDEGYVRGSARCPGKTELKSFKEFLNESGMFEYTAGHDFAFGISLSNSKLKKFHEYANEKLKDIDFGENLYEVQLVREGTDKDIKDIVFDLSNYEQVWSQQNETPLLAINNIFLKNDDIQVIGKNKDTVRFEKNGITYIKFFGKDIIEKLTQYDSMIINVIGKTAVNNWMGRLTPQIMIEDLEVKNAADDLSF